MRPSQAQLPDWNSDKLFVVCWLLGSPLFVTALRAVFSGKMLARGSLSGRTWYLAGYVDGLLRAWRLDSE